MRATWLRPLLLALAIICLGLVATAQAQNMPGPAVTTTNVNMRVGPGTSYGVVEVLRGGERVEIVRCTGGWCLTDFGRQRGWISQSFLRPVISSPGPGGPNWGGGGGGGGGNIAWGRACFYEDLHFRGRSFCLRQGESDRSLGRWENRISSIAVEGRQTWVDVCSDRNFRNCSTFDRNVPVLNFRLQQNVSSVRVH